MQVIQQKREDTLTTIVALLVPHKGGCPLSHLCRDYHEMVGEEIPWRELGYTSLMNFLHSMSKSIQIEYRNNMVFLKGIASNKSKHISQLVSGQKDQKLPVGRKMFKPSHYYPMTAPFKVHIPADTLAMIIGIVNEHPDGVNKDFVFQKVQDRMPQVNITMNEMEEQLHRLSHKIYLCNNKIFPALRKPHSINQILPSVTAAGEENLTDMIDEEDEDDFRFMSPRSMPTLDPMKSSTKAKSTSNFIMDSVSATQSQCKSNAMNNRVKEVSAQSETNKSSLFTFSNDNNNASINSNNNNKEEENYVENNYAEDLINSRVRFRLEKLIQNNPDGIWCAELPEKYLEEYKLPLNYTELGFSSVREFASQLPNIFQCVQISKTGDSILYDSKRRITSSGLKEKQNSINLAKLHEVYLKEDENEALPTTLTLSTCNQLIPEGIVTIGESVGQISVTDLVSEEKPYIEVIVVEVFTPTFFWIQLRKKQKAFKTFMDDLHNFYVTKHHDLVIPPVILEKGLNCACIYNNIWHRGIIKTVKPDMQVTVMFYDYGTLKTYHPNEIYYLHRMFSILPAQAIPCGLYNVRPYRATKWSRTATHKFAVRTSTIPFVATVEPQWINETDNSMLITLTDTIEEEDVHINDWLVEQKLAEHGRMADKVEMHNLLLYVEENLLYSPEQCYQEEYNASNTVSNVRKETSENPPLISPQSTLEDQNLQVSLQPELSGKYDKSTNIQDQTQVKNNSVPRIMKPFTLQDEPICNLDSNKISTENLIQMWNENLKLQIQISSVFEILFNKARSNSESDDNLKRNENTLNTMSAMSNLNTNSNLVKTCPFNIKDVQHVGDLSRELLNDNLNIHNYTNVLKDSLKELNTLINIDGGRNSDKASQMFPKKSASSKIPPGFEKINSKVDLDLPNQCTNTVNIDLSETFEKPASFNIPLKETNPFKVDIINKLQKSQEENHLNSDGLFSSNKDQGPFVKHTVFKENDTAILNTNLDVAKKFSANNPFGYQQYYSTSQLSTTDNTDTSTKFLSTDYPRPNVTSNTGIVANSFSTMLGVNNFHSATNHLRTESENYDAYKYTPSYLRIRSQEHVQKQEENVVLKHPLSTTTPCTGHALSDGNNCTTTSWLPINSFPSPVIALQDSKSIDEGYLTRPPTLDRSSSLTQTIANVDDNSAFTKIWSISATDNLAQSEKSCQTYLQSTKNENISQLPNSNCHSVSVDTPLDRKVYIKLIELPKRQVHVFHYQNEGWLLIEEFISFTKLTSVAYMFDILRILDFTVPLVEIDRTQCSIECLELTSSNKQLTKDIIHGFNNLCLIQLKSTLKLLKKLKVISAQELNDLFMQNKFESGSVMHEISVNISNRYGVRLHVSNISRDNSTYNLI